MGVAKTQQNGAFMVLFMVLTEVSNIVKHSCSCLKASCQACICREHKNSEQASLPARLCTAGAALWDLMRPQGWHSGLKR